LGTGRAILVEARDKPGHDDLLRSAGVL